MMNICVEKSTEEMDEQLEQVYGYCLLLLSRLYDGRKVHQDVLVDAVVQAWEIHNRCAEICRHNLRVEAFLRRPGRPDPIGNGADPAHLAQSFQEDAASIYFSNEGNALVDLARELLMETVDYPVRKVIERQKTPGAFDFEATKKRFHKHLLALDGHEQDILEMHNVYTLRHLSRAAQVNLRQAREWCVQGLVRARQANGGQWLISADSAEDFLIQHAASAAA